MFLLIYLKLKKIPSDNLLFRTSNSLVCIVKSRDYWVLLFLGKQSRCDGELKALQAYDREIRTSMLMERSGSSRMDQQPTHVCHNACFERDFTWAADFQLKCLPWPARSPNLASSNFFLWATSSLLYIMTVPEN